MSPYRPNGRQRRLNVGFVDAGAIREDDQPLDEVAQLAHVAWPIVLEKQRHGRRRDFERSLTVLGTGLGGKVLDQGGEVLLVLAQRGELEGDDVQPIVEVGAETPVFDLLS